jgi:hypothetical protein
MKPARVTENAGGFAWSREESESVVRLRSVMHQKTGQLELSFGTKGETPTLERSGETPMASNENERSGNTTALLMEEVVQRSNAAMALRRVRKNKGSPGIDEMTVQELPVR